ncbi:hypothetical protein PTSG_08840 [Salpingoeca rosetta]|uniref:Uncharacterized protein n=1 Tax=Salpingoeca rosetta (strain ATCC 50818 / BSB-021) TaxID=946362 RepID=F2UKV2_SALR5|nr:uncharacterized protein PTSG_08840 [Salpingoeca rosetta]EGD77751.1 hypothetical protein PTSG_08840 [Salpingoeca rosetta]|eukprot:XP_004990227.1 hypothetical protein PTSG_08840 [Salpingoeca rosetta]
MQKLRWFALPTDYMAAPPPSVTEVTAQQQQQFQRRRNNSTRSQEGMVEWGDLPQWSLDQGGGVGRYDADKSSDENGSPVLLQAWASGDDDGDGVGGNGGDGVASSTISSDEEAELNGPVCYNCNGQPIAEEVEEAERRRRRAKAQRVLDGFVKASDLAVQGSGVDPSLAGLILGVCICFTFGRQWCSGLFS